MFDIKPPTTQRNLYVRPDRLPLWERTERIALDQRRPLCEIVAAALEHYLPTVEHRPVSQDPGGCCPSHSPPLDAVP